MKDVFKIITSYSYLPTSKSIKNHLKLQSHNVQNILENAWLKFKTDEKIRATDFSTSFSKLKINNKNMCSKLLFQILSLYFKHLDVYSEFLNKQTK